MTSEKLVQTSMKPFKPLKNRSFIPVDMSVTFVQCNYGKHNCYYNI